MAHPRMYDDAQPAIRRLRELCLALPDAFEKEAWGECTFRVRGGSMFAMTDNHHHGSEHIAVWVKAPPQEQEILVAADPSRFFVPPYVGPKGWIGVRLDRTPDWEALRDILAQGHALSAPTRRRARRVGEETVVRADAPPRRRRRAPRATAPAGRAASTKGVRTRR